VVVLRHLECALRGRQRRLGRIHLGRGRQILGLGVVQFLLRHQAGLSLVGLQQPLVIVMQSGVHGLRPRDLALRAHDLVPAARHFRHRPGQLRLQLGDFQHRQGFALVHAVADIHVNMLNETGDFGMDVDYLVRLELPRQGEHLIDAAPLHGCHLRGGRTRSSVHRRRLMASPQNQQDDHNRENGGGGYKPQTLMHS
jgi:hypothetical protein